MITVIIASEPDCFVLEPIMHVRVVCVVTSINW